MEEADSLEALSNLLTKLSETPYDLSLHVQHIQLADASAMPEQAYAAREMMTTFWATTEDVWIPMIEAKKAEGTQTLESVQAILQLYEKAEADYFSINLLYGHLQFLIDSHEYFNPTDGPRPVQTGEFFTSQWTRDALEAVAFNSQTDMFKSHLIWKPLFEWELEQLDGVGESERESLVAHIQQLFLARLQQPHAKHDETFQEYSTFTTANKPESEYESLLLSANKTKAQAIKVYEKREQSEMYLSQSQNSLDSFNYCVATERRAKKPDLFALRGLYERAVAAAARKRFANEVGAEEYLRMFWIGYVDILRQNDAVKSEQLPIFTRALRSVPGSGELWARYFRFLEAKSAKGDDEDADVGDGADDVMDIETETVADAYTRAMATGLFSTDIEQIVPLTLARASYELRQGNTEEEVLAYTATALQTVEEGIALNRKVSPQGDPRFRLEKYLAETCRRMGLHDNAKAAWKAATDHHKTSYVAWTSYADLLIRLEEIDEARALYRKICFKNLDWPEAIWEAWSSLEYQVGDVEELEDCLDIVERARTQAETRRGKEATKALHQSAQIVAEHQASTIPVGSIDRASTIEVDAGPVVTQSKKRKAEDSPAPDDVKRIKTDPAAPPPKRDRENCTVFVANLPHSTVEAELTLLFKDCGKVREVKITEADKYSVATVEFFDRSCIPAALTKDKKRVNGAEVSVHLAWQSTLYVTNFPEHMDDASIRNLFAQYGTIFDVRWPSKKFKNTRRFCYVQYTSPSAAQAALPLSGRELEPGLALSVLVSNPERKKERTDADANERELYIAGLSRFVAKADLEKLFRTYGPIRDVRVASDGKGQCKGFAFVEFENVADAISGLAANNYELKKRRIAVTLADTRVTASNREDAGNRKARRAGRSLRIKGLPDGTQEGLLQQTLEKVGPIKRVEVLQEKHEAIVVFENAADVGTIMLKNEPFEFMGQTLSFSQDNPDGASASAKAGAPPPASVGMFVPRTAASRPRAGLGRARKPGKGATSSEPQTTAVGPSAEKGQDDFRKMMGL